MSMMIYILFNNVINSNYYDLQELNKHPSKN